MTTLRGFNCRFDADCSGNRPPVHHDEKCIWVLTMELGLICGIVLAALTLSLVLKKDAPAIAFLLVLTAGVILLLRVFSAAGSAAQRFSGLLLAVRLGFRAVSAGVQGSWRGGRGADYSCALSGRRSVRACRQGGDCRRCPDAFRVPAAFRAGARPYYGVGGMSKCKLALSAFLVLLLFMPFAHAAVSEEQVQSVGGSSLTDAMPNSARQYLDGVSPENADTLSDSVSRVLENMTSDSQSAIRTALGGLLRVAVIVLLASAARGFLRRRAARPTTGSTWRRHLACGSAPAGFHGCAVALPRHARPDQRVFGLHFSHGARHRTCDRRQHGDRNRSAGGKPW